MNTVIFKCNPFVIIAISNLLTFISKPISLYFDYVFLRNRIQFRMLSTDVRNTIKKYCANCGITIQHKHKHSQTQREQNQHWYVQRINCGKRCADLLNSSFNHPA